jgi:curved DNA-binding protein CbpA
MILADSVSVGNWGEARNKAKGLQYMQRVGSSHASCSDTSRDAAATNCVPNMSGEWFICFIGGTQLKRLALQGSGQIIDEYCGTCSGRGRVQKSKQLMITIPPGVDNGSRLRIRKEGDAGPKGGPPGDLYVFISVQTSKDFKREGADIYSQVCGSC